MVLYWRRISFSKEGEYMYLRYLFDIINKVLSWFKVWYKWNLIERNFNFCSRLDWEYKEIKLRSCSESLWSLVFKEFALVSKSTSLEVVGLKDLSLEGDALFEALAVVSFEDIEFNIYLYICIYKH